MSMMSDQVNTLPKRPEKIPQTPVPPIPHVDESNADIASVTYSHYRTGLSNHRTGLSEHRTQLSEYRTDLSTHRTDLSTDRTEMSMRRTGMSFQRTRMSADRTLMSVLRTSLSLIGFGFTIFQFFEKLRESGTITHSGPPRNFGIALVLIGILMLAVGIVYHVQFMLGLRDERAQMHAADLIHAESKFPPSLTLMVAVLLLILGLFAIVSMVFQVGPFG
jgi:uncharacterized membrane protein YidH (DUF202 family)